MLFQIDKKSNSLRLLESKWNPKELDIEKYLITLSDENLLLSSIVFGEDLLIISRQVKTRYKKRADILALDRQGNGVIIELKREQGRLGVETQALQYLADFSKYKGLNFIRKFEKENNDLENIVRGFIGDNAKIEEINQASRIILVARHFDETLFSMGEWLSEKGVSFRCISYQPTQINDKQFLSFSVAFDRAETSIYRLSFTPAARAPKIFWHNIGKPSKGEEEKWWNFLTSNNQIACGFQNSLDDQGARIFSGYIAEDRIVAYMSGYGALGWGIIEDPQTYRIIPIGDKDDVMNGRMRHRMNISWKSFTKKPSNAMPSSEFQSIFKIYHPVSTSTSINAETGKLFLEYLSERFGTI